MSERVQHPYRCQNLGCPNGHLSVFMAAPPEWFAAKGLSSPKSCPDCRAWIKAQTDSAFHCEGCSYIIRQSARAKISYHKRVGVYEPPKLCYRCKEGEKPRRESRERPKSPPELEYLRSPEALTLKDYDQLTNYRLVHYGKHIPGHPFSEVGNIKQGSMAVSQTLIVGAGASSHEFYQAGEQIAGYTAGVYQYNKGRYTIKVTVIDSSHVELTFFEPTDDGTYELITSYDNVTIKEARKNIEDGIWT